MTQIGKLTVTTPGDRELAMTRVFDAPRRMLFDAWTKPELLRRWLCPTGWKFVVCEVDLKIGGAYRFVWRREAEGMDMGMGGTYREIKAPERLVASEKFDVAWYPGEAQVTTTWVENAGKTTATTTVRYETREGRDMAVNSGMAQGVAMTYEQLAEMLATSPARSDA